eukprot:TRINITY_DN2947_c0_g1_i2.p1 TRINITY_DN2947_c0_g1~~TRINITY_DN2947_c0_g1_i2.p1  ORF type:complete len:355 (-),score=75.27 TRINITY_DN2947_c0_g1_i2:22-1086(-)
MSLSRRVLNFRPKQRHIPRHFYSTSRTLTLIPGDGIGPEISEAMKTIFKEAGVPVDWETQHVTPEKGVTDEVIQSIHRNGVGLKGPLATPIGKGHRSLNLALRQEFDLFANVRPAKTVVGARCGYDNVDVVTIRENTEGEYSGIEHKVAPGVHESIKLITYEASKRVADYAFQYAIKHGRKRVTAVHLAKVMRQSDGLFADTCREVSTKYPLIKYEEMTLGHACMKLVMNPADFDVMVLPNLYGDVVSDLCAGLIGGLGLTPSGNIGAKYSIFESVHGTAPDIAGKDLANPTALVMSAVMMLRHIHLENYANVIENAILSTIKERNHVTKDLGGDAKCSEFVDAVRKAIQKTKQ